MRIDKNIFRFIIHVVSDVHSNHNLSLGSDLWQFAKIIWDGTNAEISKRNVGSSEFNVLHKLSDVPEVFCIDVSDSNNDDSERRHRKVNSGNIKDPAVNFELEEIIDNYQPRGTKQVAISLNLILENETPIYERARRLAPAEKKQVDAIVQGWIREGIIRLSTS